MIVIQAGRTDDLLARKTLPRSYLDTLPCRIFTIIYIVYHDLRFSNVFIVQI